MNTQDALAIIESCKHKRYAHHYNFPLMTSLLQRAVNGWMEKNTYPDNTSKRLHLKGIEAAQDYLESRRVRL